jgi:hypothetical protein
VKTAIYIEDGVVQLVLTPEDDFEKNALKSFNKEGLETKIFHGQFYDCRAGWTRQKNYHEPFNNTNQDQSLIIRVGNQIDSRPEITE